MFVLSKTAATKITPFVVCEACLHAASATIFNSAEHMVSLNRLKSLLELLQVWGCE